jgi:hypothetical protein
MGLFSALVGVAVEVVKMPVRVVADVVCIPKDAAYDEQVGHRTINGLEEIKKAAEKADE